MWKYFHRFASPRWFYQFSGKVLPWLAAFSIALLIVGSIWALLFAPEDARQGNSYRIIYIHVPSAFLAQFAFLMMAIAGLVSLVWRIKMAGWALKSIAPIGASFTTVALITGAIWGKPTWGTWWEWDARLTSMLILFFLYLGVIALGSAITDKTTAGKASAILSLVGVVNLPIIKFSVEWWNTLHQPATIKLTEKSNIHPEMFWPLLLMIFAFNVFFVFVTLLRLRNEILYRERRTKWVRTLMTDHKKQEV